MWIQDFFLGWGKPPGSNLKDPKFALGWGRKLPFCLKTPTIFWKVCSKITRKKAPKWSHYHTKQTHQFSQFFLINHGSVPFSYLIAVWSQKETRGTRLSRKGHKKVICSEYKITFETKNPHNRQTFEGKNRSGSFLCRDLYRRGLRLRNQTCKSGSHPARARLKFFRNRYCTRPVWYHTRARRARVWYHSVQVQYLVYSTRYFAEVLMSSKE